VKQEGASIHGVSIYSLQAPEIKPQRNLTWLSAWGGHLRHFDYALRTLPTPPARLEVAELFEVGKSSIQAHGVEVGISLLWILSAEISKEGK